MIGREIGAGDPKAGVRYERPERLNDEVALGGSPQRFERAIELLPAPGQRAHAFFRDGHVRLERARGDARIVVVVDPHPVLSLGLAIRLQGDLAGGLAVEVGKKRSNEGASHVGSA